MLCSGATKGFGLLRVTAVFLLVGYAVCGVVFWGNGLGRDFVLELAFTPGWVVLFGNGFGRAVLLELAFAPGWVVLFGNGFGRAFAAVFAFVDGYATVFGYGLGRGFFCVTDVVVLVFAPYGTTAFDCCVAALTALGAGFLYAPVTDLLDAVFAPPEYG